MLNILISFLTFVLILASLFMVLVILMQRANTNAGMGSAFGGGVTESAFGAETTNILTRATKWTAVVFFLLSLVLYLLYMSQLDRPPAGEDMDLPDIPAPTEALPAPEGLAEDTASGAAGEAMDEAGSLPAPEQVAEEAEQTAAEEGDNTPAP